LHIFFHTFRIDLCSEFWYGSFVMDIVRILTLTHFKASFEKLYLKQKFFLLVFLLAIFLNLIPHQTYAFTIKVPTAREPVLIFDMNDKTYEDIVTAFNASMGRRFIDEKSRQEALRVGKLTIKVQSYLASRGSPLAEYTPILVTAKSWKQIVALSNAESSMCRNYQEKLSNCWGVGGSNLWDMGNNLGDGILSMSKFLAQHPTRSKVKYSQMTFKQMNGLYKQPAADHWLYNAQSIYDDLVAIEKSVQ
jgi:hypothetical protein